MKERRLALDVLYDPAGADKTPIRDVVLIHGIDGHRVKTWQASDTMVWPRDLLPVRQPQTRVLSFGYNADMYRNTSIGGIPENANTLLQYLDGRRRDDPHRPLSFIAHCLGGLILKQALYTARNNVRWKSIFDATETLIFLGTPHQGTNKDEWDRIASSYRAYDKSIGVVGRLTGKRSPLVQAMKKNSDDLAEINDKFKRIAPNFRILNRYRNTKTEGSDSGMLGQTDCEMEGDDDKVDNQQIEGTHFEMCRFDDEADQDFQIIADAILGIGWNSASKEKARAVEVPAESRLAIGEAQLKASAPVSEVSNGKGNPVFVQNNIFFASFQSVDHFRAQGGDAGLPASLKLEGATGGSSRLIAGAPALGHGAPWRMTAGGSQREASMAPSPAKQQGALF